MRNRPLLACSPRQTGTDTYSVFVRVWWVKGLKDRRSLEWTVAWCPVDRDSGITHNTTHFYVLSHASMKTNWLTLKHLTPKNTSVLVNPIDSHAMSALKVGNSAGFSSQLPLTKYLNQYLKYITSYSKNGLKMLLVKQYFSYYIPPFKLPHHCRRYPD